MTGGIRSVPVAGNPGGLRIFDAAQTGRLVRALAASLDRAVTPSTRLVGIDERGLALAHLIAAELSRPRRWAPARLDPGALGGPAEGPPSDGTFFPGFEGADGDPVVLVDTALHRGRRIMRAVRHLAAAGAGRIEVAVLCLATDQPGEGPPQCIYGTEVTLREGERLRVRVPPVDEDLDVWMMTRS